MKQAAPKTVIRRVSSVCAFYNFIREQAIEARLPVQIPNPAAKQFIDRRNQDPVEPTEALSKAHARKLLRLPLGDSAVAHRDRAILACFLYTGVRIGTVCRLAAKDFRYSEHNPTLRIQEKGHGGSKRAIGLHVDGADIIEEYAAVAGIRGGPLFPARTGPNGDKLSRRHMTESGMYRLVLGYLRQLPAAIKDDRCIYSPHSLRATTATLLLAKGVPIQNVQELLGHKSVTVTQIYNKRRLATRESASHELDF